MFPNKNHRKGTGHRSMDVGIETSASVHTRGKHKHKVDICSPGGGNSVSDQY